MKRILVLLSIIALLSACQKKDTVLTPQQEAEYQQMMQKAQRDHPPKTYGELQRENDELKDKEMRRAMEK